MDGVAAACVGLVAGSGIDLTAVLDTIESEHPFSEFAGIPAGHVVGHARKFVVGYCGDTRVVVQCGRVHVYEGFDYEAVTAPVAAMKSLGVDTVIFTNAAGGFNPNLPPASLIAIDRIATWPYPRYALPRELAPDFNVPGCDASGTYYWMHGPCYETRAEIAALRKLDADAVGMSVAPELLRAQKFDMRAAVISCITNVCGEEAILVHSHVLNAAKVASPRLAQILGQYICRRAR